MGLGGLIGGMIGAGASLIGGSAANQANVAMAENATAANIWEARRNRRWQEEMSNTAYQRATADMKKAGINPMLAYMQGGASSPGGSTGSAVAGHVEDVATPALSSAMDVRRLKKDLDATDAAISLQKTQEDTQKTQSHLNATSAKVAEANAKIAEAQVPAARAKAKFEEKSAKIGERMADYDAYATRIHQATGVVSNVKDLFTPKIGVSKVLPKFGDILVNSKGQIKHEYGK